MSVVGGVVPVVPVSNHRNSLTILSCLYSLLAIRLSGAHLSALNALPIPTHHSTPAGPGSIGSVPKTFFQIDSTLPPIAFPSSLACIDAKNIIRISPMAKKFTIIHESQSIVDHRVTLENSSLTHSKSTVSVFVAVFWITVTPMLSWMASLVSGAVKPLTRAVIKISEMLSAATETTGAKMIPITPEILRYLLSLIALILSDFLNVASRMMKGEETI
ncbi:MAG: hypothetical protein WCJ45_04085 [bacterium]